MASAGGKEVCNQGLASANGSPTHWHAGAVGVRIVQIQLARIQSKPIPKPQHSNTTVNSEHVTDLRVLASV